MELGTYLYDLLTFCLDRSNNDEVDDDDDNNNNARCSEKVFADDARLFSDGVCSGDVIQGNLGDCWFLSELSSAIR